MDSETWTPSEGPAGRAFRIGGSSHRGRIRAVNEDAWLALPPVFLVADGMGGHRFGDLASSTVTDSFSELARGGAVDVAAVESCIARCRERLVALADDSGPAPGSTLVAAVYLVEDGVGYWLLANIGDSRAYQLSGDRLEQLSHDHSVVQELVDSGAIAPGAAATHPERHVVTRALGAITDAAVDYSLIPVAAGTKILLCSDGVSSELDDATIAALLDSGREAGECAEALVAEAVGHGGRDNATALVIEVLDSEMDSDIVGRGSALREDTMPGGGRRR